MGETRYNRESDRTAAQTAADPDQISTAKEVDDVATPKPNTAPAFQFYPKDFLSSAKVSAMSMTERGVYITLLAHCWLDSGLPTDVKALARIVGMKPSQFGRMWTEGALASCFNTRGDKLQNPRLDRERRAQAEYRAKQAENGKRGGRPKKPVGSSGLSQTEPNESSSSPSSSPSSVRTHTQRQTTPIHTSHIRHAACGRVCVPADLHTEFVSSLNRDDADKVLRDWYLTVDNEWSVGAKAKTNTGGNNYAFWRARFTEKWPPEPIERKATGTDARRPKWAVTP